MSDGGGPTYLNIGIETETDTTFFLFLRRYTLSGIEVGEIRPENLFGEKAEGEFPETETWFGNNALVKEQVNEVVHKT